MSASCNCAVPYVHAGGPLWECPVCKQREVRPRKAETKFNSRIPNAIEEPIGSGLSRVAKLHIIVDEEGETDGVPNRDVHIIDFSETNAKMPPIYRIDGYGMAKKDQYFRPPEIPFDWTKRQLERMAERFPRLSNGKLNDRWWENSDLYKANPSLFKGIPYEKMMEFMRQEWDRRMNGHWFFNSGIATYITGAHYVYLVYGRMPEGTRPEFRYVDWMVHHFWEQCVEQDYQCLGGLFPKYRRGGFTAMGLNIGLEKITRTSSVQMGIVSKTDTDAQKTFKRLVRQFTKSYPEFWKPQQAGRSDPESRLVFALPSTNASRGISGVSDEAQGLDSEVSFEATTEGAYDSQQLYFALIDETGKMIKVDAYKLWDTIKETLQQGSTVFGKAWVPSTVEELELKGGENFRRLANASRLNTTDPYTGQTASGLKRFFVPYEYGMEGYIDRYGFPLLDSITEEQIEWVCRDNPKKKSTYRVGVGALKVLDSRYSQQKSMGKGSLYRRKFPRKYKDCFIADGRGCLFDSELINDRLAYLDTVVRSELVSRGHFRWKDGIRFSEVEWVEQSSMEDFAPFEIDRRLLDHGFYPKNKVGTKVTFSGTEYYPQSTTRAVGGLDPYDHDGVENHDRSKAALYGLLTEADKSSFFLEYLCRRSKSKQMWEDVLMACWYFGMKVLVESNKPGFLNWMRDIGCGPFLHQKPNSLSSSDASKTQKRDTSEDAGLYNSSNGGGYNINSAITEQWDLYLTDASETIIFPRLLSDLLIWDDRKATKHDAVVGSGYALLAANTHREVRRPYSTSILADDWPTYE